MGRLAGMTKDWERLAQAVNARRKELGLSQDAIRQAGGPSDVVIARIESNDEPHPRDDTVNKLDAPLRWEPGSAQRVLVGGEPTGLRSTQDIRLDDVSIDELVEWRRKIEEALRKRFERPWDGVERRIAPRKDAPPI